MRTVLIAVSSLALLSATPAVRAVEPQQQDQREQVSRLLAQLKTQAASAKPAQHDVALPVATAGARGDQARAGNRFAVVWPAAPISPLTALVRNLDAELKAKPMSALAPQVTEFVTIYPEYEGDALLQELVVLLGSSKQASAQ